MSSEEYPPDWDSRRKEVYQRDDYTCQNCGVKGGPEGSAEIHAHHIVPKSKGGAHKKSNLKTICKECHNAIHGDSMAPSSTATGTKDEGIGFIGKLVGIFFFVFLVAAIQPFLGFVGQLTEQLPVLISLIFGIFFLMFLIGVPVLTGAYVSYKIKNS